MELAEQIEILQEAKSQIELLNPGADVDIEMECQGERLLRDDVPASSTTGVRIIRCDKVWEGRGRSVSDIFRGKGFARSHAVERHRSFLRKMWHSRGSLDADGVYPASFALSIHSINHIGSPLSFAPSPSPVTLLARRNHDVIDTAHLPHPLVYWSPAASSPHRSHKPTSPLLLPALHLRSRQAHLPLCRFSLRALAREHQKPLRRWRGE